MRLPLHTASMTLYLRPFGSKSLKVSTQKRETDNALHKNAMKCTFGFLQERKGRRQKRLQIKRKSEKMMMRLR